MTQNFRLFIVYGHFFFLQILVLVEQIQSLINNQIKKLQFIPSYLIKIIIKSFMYLIQLKIYYNLPHHI